MKRIGVLVMAYGGPAALEEIPGYLSDIRSGRPTTPAVLEEITRNYRMIGGSSPLLEISRRQAGALQQALGTESFQVFLGMRHWAPWIEDVVGEMIDAGVERAVSIVLAPHFSSLSVRRYQEKIDAGLGMYRGRIEFRHVDNYHEDPHLIEAFAGRLLEALDAVPAHTRDRVHVVFSAHSLPVRIINEGDPYADQLQTTARLIAAAAGIPPERWSWSYQSAGKSPEPWLEPDLPDHLESLAERGISDVLVQAVGFVSDHVEILYDIDIEAQETARRLGMTVGRPRALNDDPRYIAALTDAVLARASSWL